MNNDTHIILDKELRRDIDAIIQRLKQGYGVVCDLPFVGAGNYRDSEERKDAIKSLQLAVMWLGMDLKAINDANPQPSQPPKTPLECAKDAYQRYGAVTDFKNFRGDPMPSFEDLGDKIQQAWIAAACPMETGNPYPNSKDPSNTVIDKTADGLQL